MHLTARSISFCVIWAWISLVQVIVPNSSINGTTVIKIPPPLPNPNAYKPKPEHN